MSDDLVVGGDPDKLTQYSSDVLDLLGEDLSTAVEEYRSAVQAFTAAPSDLETNVPDRSLDVESALTDLEDADRIPGAFGEMLAEFDSEWADAALAELIAEDPGLAASFAASMDGDEVEGEHALAVLLAFVDEVDIAGQDAGDADGKFTVGDLERIVGDESQPEALRQAAQHLLDNPVLFGLVETINTSGIVLGEDGDGELSRADIEMYFEFNHNLQVVAENFDEFDTADDGGDGDGRVSINDLEAVAAGTGPLAQAAQWWLDHDTQRERLDQYEESKRHGADRGVQGDDGLFSDRSVLGLLVDQQAYANDPEAARQFVLDLPIPERGDEGIPIWLCSDEGTRALANAALIDTGGDLTDAQAVISHLPETNGGVRNELITGFYSELAHRADALFAGDLAGDPETVGHPGANWLYFAPWASDGVRDAITGDLSVYGFNPLPGQRQAAADGNQMIFSDVATPFAAFIEMYEANLHPSEDQLETFFAESFQDGDAEFREGFVSYVGVMEETDPVRRQELMFEANTSVAIHEQALVDPYLHRVSVGPDDLVTEYIDFQIGTADAIDVNHDVPENSYGNNHVVDADLLDLDPAELSLSDYQASGTDSTRFSGESPDDHSGVVDLAPLEGVDSWADDFPTSSQDWLEEGGQVTEVTPAGPDVVITDLPGDPDGLEGSGASSWPDEHERMWTILKLFEQNHTNPQLYETARRELELGNIDWLDPATGLG